MKRSTVSGKWGRGIPLSCPRGRDREGVSLGLAEDQRGTSSTITGGRNASNVVLAANNLGVRKC